MLLNGDNIEVLLEDCLVFTAGKESDGILSHQNLFQVLSRFVSPLDPFLLVVHVGFLAGDVNLSWSHGVKSSVHSPAHLQ